MYLVLSIVLIILALLLMLTVLLQPGKGDLTATFGGISSQFGAVFGMQKANKLLLNATMILAGLIVLISLGTNLAIRYSDFSSPTERQRTATEGAEIPTQQTPQAPPVQRQVPPPNPNQ